MSPKAPELNAVRKDAEERQGHIGSFQVRGAMQVVLEALQVELKTDAQATRMWDLKDRDLKEPVKEKPVTSWDRTAP